MCCSIIIIDDEPRICISLKVLLNANGYDIAIANTGKEAMDYICRDYYDLALLDICLPDVDGHQLADSISRESPDTSIILITGNATVDSAIKALRKGIFDYIKKPFEYNDLLKTIKNAINHKRLEIALRESEALFRKLSEATSEGIIIYDENAVLQVNQQFYDMFGYDQNDLNEKRFNYFIKAQKFFKHIELRVDASDIRPYEMVGLRKDGTHFPIEVRIKEIKYHGKLAKVAAIRNISARIKAEKEKLALQQKLAMSNKMEALGLMAGSVAHDLNNILSGIINYPELILMNLPEESSLRKPLEIIYQSGQKAAAIVSDLMTITRGAMNSLAVLNLNQIIKEYLISAEYKELEKKFHNIKIELQLDPDLMPIKGSFIHIGKALMNLIINAFEAIDRIGKIRISTENLCINTPVEAYENIPKGEYVLFMISDDGHGISITDMEKIFEPFYSKKVLGRSGTGLGLAIVWNAVKDRNGYIDVASSKKGTTFSLYFPITKDIDVVTEQATSVKDYIGNKEKILIIDDQDNQRNIACEILIKLGYRPKAVSSGEEAIEYLKNNFVELLLLDMIMEPGINGFETYKRILKIYPNQKAIIVSGFSESKDVESTQKLGAGRYLKKPYTIKSLGEAIKYELST